MRNLVPSVTTCAAEPRERREIEDGLNLEGYAVLWGGGLDSGSVLGGCRGTMEQSPKACAKDSPERSRGSSGDRAWGKAHAKACAQAPKQHSPKARARNRDESTKEFEWSSQRG